MDTVSAPSSLVYQLVSASPNSGSAGCRDQAAFFPGKLSSAEKELPHGEIMVSDEQNWGYQGRPLTSRWDGCVVQLVLQSSPWAQAVVSLQLGSHPRLVPAPPTQAHLFLFFSLPFHREHSSINHLFRNPHLGLCF